MGIQDEVILGREYHETDSGLQVFHILHSLWETLPLAAAKQLSVGAKQSMQQLEK